MEMEIKLRRIFTVFLFFAFLFSFLGMHPSLADDILEEPFTGVLPSSGTALPTAKKPAVDAGAAIVMDVKSGRILYEKNSRTRRSIASTTKIMTAILAIENGNLEDTVTISKKAAAIGGSTIGLKTGQTFTLNELLYGLMLNSGNDAAIAIAEHIGGSVEGFADRMNAKAAELGVTDTNYITPHGLDRDGQYSSAFDLATITRYALENPVFCKIVSTHTASIPVKHLHNTNEMLDLYPGADGVKTGYTGQAGRCLVTSATRGGMRLISVVLNCPSRAKRAQSSKSVLDYAFTNYKPHTLVEEKEHVKDIPVIKGMSPNISLCASTGIEMPMSQDEINSVEKVLELPDILPAPIKKGTEVGMVKFLINGEIFGSVPVETSADIAKKGIWNYLGEIFQGCHRIMTGGLGTAQ